MPTRGSPGDLAGEQPNATSGHSGHFITAGSSAAERAAFVETIIASAGGGIMAFDRDLRFTVWNPFMEQLTGLRAADVLGQGVARLAGYVVGADAPDQLLRALAGEETTREFEFAIPETGRQGRVVDTARPHLDSKGRVVGVVCSVLDVTASREAQSALERSEAQFRTIFDSVSEGIAITDTTGRFVEVNRSTCERLGYTRSEMIGMEARLTNQPETASEIIGRIGRIMAGSTEVFEATHVRRDGTLIPTEVAARRITFHGRPAVLSVVRDTIDRKRAEAAVREQAAYLQQLIDAVPIPIIAKNPDGTIRIANAAFAEKAPSPANVGSEDIVGRRTKDIGVAESELHRGHDEEILRDGTVHTYEYSASAPDGVRRIVMTKAPLRAPDGSIEGIATAAIDITDRYEMEQALRQSEERFRTLFEHAADAIYITDPSGAILDVNRAATELTGYSHDELVGRRVAELDAPDEVANVPGRFARLLETGSLSFVTAQVRRDGTIVPIEMSARVIDLDGKPAVLAIGRDISERRRAEAERIQLEEQLQQSRKMEGIGQLAGGIAHDFNNLLTAIRGYSTLALSEVPEDSPARDDLIQIEQASDRAAALTRQLLAFARRTVLKPEVVDLKAAVRRLEPMLERLLGEDVTLAVESTAPRGRVLADPSQVEQVVVNLAVNARDAMPDGGVLTIEVADVVLDEEFVRQHSSATVGPNVMLVVSDTGTGMSEETKAHLFEPFYTTKGPGKGTGLGLATVYGIVQQSGGCITAETELGRGSRFRVFMPCVEHTSAPDAQGPAGGTQGVSTGRGGTILVVEDDRGVRGFTSRVLQLAGYRVIAADSPANAIEQDPAGIDLLLTDVVMPSMNGREVANRLLARRPDLRVLFMSGHADETIVRHGILDTTIRYLPKPFSAQALLAAIDAALADSALETDA